MNINKFTQNSMQAVQNCEALAYEYGHQEIDVEHLLHSLSSSVNRLCSRCSTSGH